jgi:hypothetical protein
MKFHGKKLEKNHVNLAEKMFLFWAHKKRVDSVSPGHSQKIPPISGEIGAGVLGFATLYQPAVTMTWEILLSHWLSSQMWSKQCHVYHPPVITMFIGGRNLPFPVMGGKNDMVYPHHVISNSSLVY